MVTCELCGKDFQVLTDVRVAGAVMKVCHGCKGLGKELEQKRDFSHTFNKKSKVLGDEKSLEVISNYGSVINSALAKKGLNHHQLARAVAIRESTLNNYLSGKMKPDIDTARKLEKFLEIKLVESVESEKVDVESLMDDGKSGSVTLGDLLERQLRKK